MTALDVFARQATHYVRPVERAQATGIVASVYAQAEREFVLAPPLTVNSPAPALLAAVWAGLRETLVVGPDRVVKEAIAYGVSSINQCPFCLDVHSVLLRAGDQPGVTQALERIESPLIRSAVEFGLGTLNPQESTSIQPPFGREQLAPFAGTSVVFHYINRMVNVFMKDSSPLSWAPQWLRAPASRVAARTFGRKMISVEATGGASLELLQTDYPSSGIGWIDSHVAIGPALSALFAVARQGGEDFLSEHSRAILRKSLERWQGESAPLLRTWLADELIDVPPQELAAARLALLSARAAHQVGENDVAAFRELHPSDDALVRIVAFGAAAAAQRVASWIAPDSHRPGI